MQERAIADKVTNMLVIQILIKKKTTHYQYKMLHAIYFTDPWDRGMAWTVRYSCVSERDRWTSRGMSHDPMGRWDGMDSGTFHGMSTCSSTDACVSHCPSHPMVSWDSGIVHRIPRSHGTVGHSIGCPHVSLTDTPTVHSIPRSHESIVTMRVKLEHTREARGAISVRLATTHFDKPTERSEGCVMLGLICKKG